MGKKLIAVAGLAMAGILAAGPATAVTYDDYILDSAINTLSNSHVYVEAGVRGFDKGQVEQSISGTNTGVAVVPNSEYVLSNSGMAQNILSQTSYDTIYFVADGNNVIYVAADIDATGKAELANSTYNATGSLEQGIITSATEYVSTSTETNPDVPAVVSDGGLPGLVVAGGLIALAIAVAGTVTWVVRKVQRDDRDRDRGFSNSVDQAVPDTMHSLLKELVQITEENKALLPQQMYMSLMAIRRHTEDLFNRIKRKGSDSQKVLAEVEYKDKLQKLIEAVGVNYYVDIARRPELWDNATGRKREVEDAVNKVDQQILENIRQINASKDLEFAIVIGSLVGSADDSASLHSAYGEPQKKKQR